MRRSATAVLLGAVLPTAALALPLSGCTRDATPAASPTPSPSTTPRPSSAPSGSASTTGGSMPEDFPTAVPRPRGRITASHHGTETGDGRGWTLITRVDGPVPRTFREISESLTSQGFRAVTPTTTVGDAVRMRTFADQHYRVDVTVSEPTDPTGPNGHSGTYGQDEHSVVNTQVVPLHRG